MVLQKNLLKRFGLWKMRDLSIEDYEFSKILAISEIVHLGLITSVPAFIIERLNIIKTFIW